MVIGAEHVRGDDLDTVSDTSRIALGVIANGGMCPPNQNSDDLEGVKLLCDEAHFVPLEAVFVPARISWKPIQVNLKLEFL